MRDKDILIQPGTIGSGRRAGGLMSVGATLAGVVAAILEWDRQQRQMARLRAMPDHMLKDMGLTRDDIGGRNPSQVASWQLWRG